MQILYRNGPRLGALTNTTMEEVSRVKTEAGDVGFLRTAKHKTALAYGDAEVLDEEVL